MNHEMKAHFLRLLSDDSLETAQAEMVSAWLGIETYQENPDFSHSEKDSGLLKDRRPSGNLKEE